MSSSQLENIWRALPSQPPFVLSTDAESIRLFNFRAKPEVQIHLEALPEPFLGRPTAPIVLLNLNPGFGEETLDFHQRNSYFKETYRRNLNHLPAAYPFYLLDPKNETSPGYEWWYKRLRALIEACGQRRVANNIFCVEYFPYASIHYGFTGTLPSQEYGFNLVRQAIFRGSVIVVMRGEKYWKQVFPDLYGYADFYRLNSVQSVYITENNCPAGYASIINRIQSSS